MRKKISKLGFIVLLILGFVYVSMYFTHEVNWSFADFCTAAVLLFGTGSMGIVCWEHINSTYWRIIALVALILGFILIWAELAVGVFGSPFAGN